jgi:zinc protease
VRHSSLLAGLLLVASAAGAADRSHPPTPAPPRPVHLPAVQRRTLANGLPLYIVEQHKLPTVFVHLVVRTGAASDPADRPGLAAMTADLLNEGAGGKDSLALADALDVLGASVGTSAGWDGSHVSLHVPIKDLAEALPLMADVALRPNFAPTELERLRKEALTSWLQLRDEPPALAELALTRAVFGAHRYGRPASGDAASLSAIRIDDVRGFHSRHYRPGNAAIIVVGDISAALATSLVDNSFGAWPAGGELPAPLPAPKPAAGRTIWLIDRPHSAQSTIRLGRIGRPRRVPDYPALEVMNAMLGGLFTSRLNDNLRETHQYAYSAGSGFSFRRVAGSWSAEADVQTPSTADAVREMLKELTRIRTPAPAEEVTRARNNLAMSYPEDFETPEQVAGKIAELIVYDLPPDTFEQYVPQVVKVSPAEVKRAAEETIDPSQLSIVIVGDRAVIEAPLRALKIGAIKILTPDEILGPAPKL